jgi:hypothetical protein
MRQPPTKSDIVKLVESCKTPGAKLAVALSAYSGLKPGQVRELTPLNRTQLAHVKMSSSTVDHLEHLHDLLIHTEAERSSDLIRASTREAAKYQDFSVRLIRVQSCSLSAIGNRRRKVAPAIRNV